MRFNSISQRFVDEEVSPGRLGVEWRFVWVTYFGSLKIAAPQFDGTTIPPSSQDLVELLL